MSANEKTRRQMPRGKGRSRRKELEQPGVTPKHAAHVNPAAARRMLSQARTEPIGRLDQPVEITRFSKSGGLLITYKNDKTDRQ
jgi:hypothetical protein